MHRTVAHPYGFFAGQVSSRNSDGFPECGRQTKRKRMMGKQAILALNVSISKTARDKSKVTINE